MKAMILAAGLGSRMMPLSKTCPKPLLKINGTSLIEHVIILLKNAGITDIAINTCHHGHKIIEQLKTGEAYGVSIKYSQESTLLGTGGGIVRALPVLGSKPFLLISGDIWTDFPVETLLNKTVINNVSHAHLVMVNNPEFHPDGDFGLTGKGVISQDLVPKLTYANIGIINPRLFNDSETIHPKAFSLTQVLNPAIASNKVTGELYQGRWWNVGTPSVLEALNAQTTKVD
jgi:N-acetyl-alpha-D-muramate 1-phosphate uridylyltransferase